MTAYLMLEFYSVMQLRLPHNSVHSEYLGCFVYIHDIFLLSASFML